MANNLLNPTPADEFIGFAMAHPSGNAPAAPAAPADEFAGFQAAPAAQPADEFSGFQPGNQLDRSTPDLVKDREGFDPVQHFSDHPEVSSDPAKLSKLLDVHRQRLQEGLNAKETAKAAIHEAIPTIKKIAGGAVELGKRAVDIGVQPLVNTVGSVITGDIFNPQMRDELAKETARKQTKGIAEINAGTESAVTGLGDLARQGLEKLGRRTFGKSAKDMNDQEMLQQISEDAAFRKQAQAIGQGQGEAAKSAGLDKDTLAAQGIQLDPDAIEKLSLVDPLTIVATGGAFKVLGIGGKLVATAATKAGAQTVVDGLTKVAGNAIKAAGEAGTKAAEFGRAGVAKAPAKVVGAAAGAVLGHGNPLGHSGGIVGGAIAGNAVKEGALKLFDAAIQGGKRVATAGAEVAGDIPKTGLVKAAADVAGSAPVTGVVKGALEGAAGGAALGAGAENDQTAGALIGGGAALGAAHGALAGAKAQVIKSVSDSLFKPQDVAVPFVKSPDYGTNPNADAAHSNAMKALDSKQQANINTMREVVRPFGREVYVLDPANFRQRLLENAEASKGSPLNAAEVQSIQAPLGDAQAFYDPARKTVFLNGNANGLFHDMGHLFHEMLPEDIQQAARDEAISAYGKDFQNLKSQYESRLGRPVSDNYYADELVAENYNALFSNKPVTALKAPKPFLTKLAENIGNVAQQLGTNIAEGQTTHAEKGLGVQPSLNLRNILEKATRKVLSETPAPAEAAKTNPETTVTSGSDIPDQGATVVPGKPRTPAEVVPPVEKPAAPIPTEVTPSVKSTVSPKVEINAPNIRVSRGKQNELSRSPLSEDPRKAAAQRAKDLGLEDAKRAVASDPALAGKVDEIERNFGNGNPVVEFEHAGITSESTPNAPLGRGARRSEQEAGYIAEALTEVPEDVRSLYQKTGVVNRLETRGSNEPQVLIMSSDKVLANIVNLEGKIGRAKLEGEVPYAMQNGKFTPEAWKQILSDLQDYTENQSNGYKGDGGKLEVPKEDVGLSIPEENSAYQPKHLSPDRADFLNALQGLNPPLTAREVKGQVPGNVKGQMLAEINARTPEKPSVIRPKDINKQTFSSGREIAETNPFRNKLAAKGIDFRDLLDVTERVNLSDVKSIKPREDLHFKAPVTDVIRGGFLPAAGESVRDFSKRVANASEEDLAGLTSGKKGGLTGGAWELGTGLKDRGDLDVLREYQTNLTDKARDLMTKGDLDAGMSAAVRSQFFREAYEAATDTGSAKKARERGRLTEPAPFPEEAAKFLPGKESPVDQEVAKRLEERKRNGYKVDDALKKKVRQEVEFDQRNGRLGKTNEPAMFLPQTEKGKELAKDGYDFRIAGPPNNRAVSVLKDGVSIGEIMSVQRQPGIAEIALAQMSKAYRGKGVGEAAYRELLTQLKKDGIKEVEGMMVAPQPIAIRKKIFGGFDELTLNGEPIGVDEAIAEAAKLDNNGGRKSPDLIAIEGRNKITPDSQFLPKITAYDENRIHIQTDSEESLRSSLKQIQAEAQDKANGLENGGGKIILGIQAGGRHLGQVDTNLLGLKAAIQHIVESDQSLKHLSNSGKHILAPTAEDIQRRKTPGQEIQQESKSDRVYRELRDQKEAEYKKQLADEETQKVAEQAANEARAVKEAPHDQKEFLKSPDKKLTGKDFKDPENFKESLPDPESPSSMWLTPEGSHYDVSTQFYHDDAIDLGAINHDSYLRPETADERVADFQSKTGAIKIGVVESQRYLDDHGGGTMGISIAKKPTSTQMSVLRGFFKAASRSEDTDSHGYQLNHVHVDVVRPDGTVIKGAKFELPNELGKLNRFLNDPFKASGEGNFLPKRKAKVEEDPYAKYNVPVKSAKSAGGLTGWIEPDSKFKPLSGGVHEDYLAQNADSLNEKYGTNFSGTPDVKERLAALNAGFVRMRLENNGVLHIEANASRWPAVKKQVTNKVLDAIDNIDRLQVNLLDNKGKVVDSTSARLFDADRPEDAATQALSELRPGSRFLPKEESSPERQVQINKLAKSYVKNAKQLWPEAIAPEPVYTDTGDVKMDAKGEPTFRKVPWRFDETPVATTAAKGIRGTEERLKAKKGALASKLVELAETGLKDPAITAGRDWYNLAREKIGKLFGKDAGFFTELLGATSARTQVPDNFKQSIDAYNRFKDGSFDGILTKYREGKQNWEDNNINDFVEATGNTDPDRNQYLSWWIDEHDLKPKKSNGTLYNANSVAVLKVLDGSWKKEVGGPKTPNFADNLSGLSDEATIDVWAARALDRAGNISNDKRWRQTPKGEGQLSDDQFFFAQDVYREAAQRLGMKPHELQALLWFGEKDHWGKKGWTNEGGKAKTDFHYFLDRTEKTSEGKLQIKKDESPQLSLDLAPKSEKVTSNE